MITLSALLAKVAFLGTKAAVFVITNWSTIQTMLSFGMSVAQLIDWIASQI